MPDDGSACVDQSVFRGLESDQENFDPDGSLNGSQPSPFETYLL